MNSEDPSGESLEGIPLESRDLEKRLEREIGARKRAEAELKRGEEYFRSVFVNSTDIVAIFDAAGTILDINPAVYRLLGRTPEDIEGINIFDRVHPDDAVSMLAAHERALTGAEGRSSIDCRFRHEDGTWRDFEAAATAFHDPATGDVRVVVTARDVTERKRAEKALREKDEINKALLNATQDIALLVDSEGRIIYANHRFLEHMGCDLASVIGKNGKEFVSPDLGESRYERLRESVESRSPVRFDDEHNGMWFEHSIYPVYNDEGSVILCAMFSHDITERKESELALKQSKAMAQSLLDVRDDTAVLVRPDGTICWANERAARFFGHPVDDLPGYNVFDFFPPEIGEPRRGAVDEVVRTGNTVRIEDEQYGSYFDSSLNPVTDSNGEVVMIAVVAHDITERKHAENALRESEEHFRSLIENASDIIVVTDTDGILTFASPSVTRELGYPIEEFIGRPGFDLVHPEDLPIVLEARSRLLENPDETVYVSYRMHDRRGAWKWVEVTARAIVQDGVTTGVILNGRDITERKLTEEELVVLNRELEGYAQTVAHNLRTPLTSIKLANETLQKIWASRHELPQEELDADIGRFSQVIHDSTRKAESLASDLLELARAGQASDDIEDVDISDVVETVLEENAGAIEYLGVEVVVDENLGRVTGNPLHVYQIFSNLVNNAIRHNTSPGPKLEVRRLKADCESGFHRFLVADNGPGIPEEDRQNIFLPFFKGTSGDTGIGLTIVDKIVRLYGGSIHEYNNGGASFEFEIRDYPT